MTNLCDCAFKIFIFFVILGPIVAVTAILFSLSVAFDSLVLVYFALIGWMCEIKICDCHEPFLVKGLMCPWEVLVKFFKKLKEFFTKPLC